jgi:hypothetical protein
LQAAAERAQRYQAQLSVQIKVPCAVYFLAEKLLALTRQFSRAEAEESALRDANNYDLPYDIVRRDAKHMCEFGSFEALIEYHNDAQKTTGLNLTRVNAILSNDSQIAKIRDIYRRDRGSHRYSAKISPNTPNRTVPQPPIADAAGTQKGGSRHARQK